jgi:hypothetical protein
LRKTGEQDDNSAVLANFARNLTGTVAVVPDDNGHFLSVSLFGGFRERVVL